MTYVNKVLLDTFKPLETFGGSVYTISISIGDVEQNGVVHSQSALNVVVDFVDSKYVQVFKGHDMSLKASHWLFQITQGEWNDAMGDVLNSVINQKQQPRRI